MVHLLEYQCTSRLGVKIRNMKTGTTEMHEGPEAFTRFREAAKKLLSAPKSIAPNPFGKRKKKLATKKRDAKI